LAGYNAARLLAGLKPLVLPDVLTAGDIIAYMHREIKEPAGLSKKYTFSGSIYFERMQDKGLYSTNTTEIAERVRRAGLYQVLSKRLV